MVPLLYYCISLKVPHSTLYGHVSVADISVITEGNYISLGQEFAHFGEPKENGNWPPHLHLQVIANMELKKATTLVCAGLVKKKNISTTALTPILSLI